MRSDNLDDDLKFAAEAISQIAIQAMRSIENLYSVQNSNHPDPKKEVKVKGFDNTSDKQPKQIKNLGDSNKSKDSSDFEDPRFKLLESNESIEPKSKDTNTISNTFELPKISDRPIKIDESLNGLMI